MFEKIELAQGVTLYVRPTTQFKTISFSFKFRTALTAQVAAERTVLTNVLQHSNAAYPTTAAYRSALDDLYGAVLYFDTAKKGTTHTLYMNAEIVNDQYLSHEAVFEPMIEVMKSALFAPNLANGEFKPAIVTREKKIVEERIEAVFDDKARFAQKRLMEILRPNHPASISANGTVAEVNAITPTSLYAAYQNMLQRDSVDIYVVGDVDVASMVATMKEAFPFTARTPVTEQQSTTPQSAEFRYVREQQTMKQGKLHIGFSTPVRFGDDDFAAMQVFNGIFGGYAHSKLFMNVREKESLAYYASSAYASHHGLVFVTSGIEAINEEKAFTLIKQQLNGMAKGNISEREMTQTKAMLKNQLREALDSARGQIEVYDQYKDLKEPFTVEAWSQKWQNVTVQEVAKMAQQMQLEAAYFLSGKEEA